MFEIGVSELLIVAIVALVVLGPERLPKAARLAGFWVRKARAQWYAVKAELESEIADEELKNSLKESMSSMQETLASHQASLQHDMQEIEQEFQGAKDQAVESLSEAKTAETTETAETKATPPDSRP
jgi:sec-independent protein translocase protein TatB